MLLIFVNLNPFNENMKEFKEQCHWEFAVLGHFCAKITTLGL